ncbi:DUF6250 domain-containing protein [Silvibacterium sp.]|uniref:DUF6250 domain-containing protein n=1 Tax=Silvibacterium sp. TaxID=1964179 RepID=UPI0039E548A3
MKSWRALGLRIGASAVIAAVPLISAGQAAPAAPPRHGKLLYKDDFHHGLDQWKLETEKPGSVIAKDGVLDIDVPAGATLWFRTKLKGPLLIEYQAKVIAEGGANDRVSDLNCFWMATDPKHPDDIFAGDRHGAFAEYNSLLTYYVGLGGNGNTTTRFRRYIASLVERPLLPQNDLSSKEFLIQPNHTQTIRLVADGNNVAFYRDAQRIFSLEDDHPYTEGWFAIRTTKSHIAISHLRIYQLRADHQG